MAKDLSAIVPGTTAITYGMLFSQARLAAKGVMQEEPTPSEWERLEEMAVNLLEPLWVQFSGLNIISAYQGFGLSLSSGERVKGAMNSAHTEGYGADITAMNGASLFELFNYIRLNLNFRDLGYVSNGTDSWIHVSYKENGNFGYIFCRDEILKEMQKVDVSYIVNKFGA